MEVGLQEVPLPEPVEMIVLRICEQQKQPPLKPYARSLLAAIGEKASIEVLTTISSSPIKFSFSGFIRKLVLDSYPTQGSSVLTAFNYQPSPQVQELLSPSTASGCNYNSPNNRASGNEHTLIKFGECSPSNNQVPAFIQ